MIGVARCSASIPMPTPAIMSVRASTTTYVSAAARATPTEAVVSSDSRCPDTGSDGGAGDSANGLGDGHGLAVLVENEVVGGLRTGAEERADKGYLA